MSDKINEFDGYNDGLGEYGEGIDFVEGDAEGFVEEIDDEFNEGDGVDLETFESGDVVIEDELGDPVFEEEEEEAEEFDLEYVDDVEGFEDAEGFVEEEDIEIGDDYLGLDEFDLDVEDLSDEDVVPMDVVYDSKGNPVHILQDGEMKVRIIEISDIDIPPRARKFLHADDLEESIRDWGLLSPIHVVPNKDRYILVHGYRRLMAYTALGNDVIMAIVDTTRPKETIRYLEVVANRSASYNFIEMMEVGAFIEERQKSFSHDTIENILGLPSGAYLKAKYIDAAKGSFDEIYNKVVRGTMTIDLAFKKIEKELNREKEEELSPLDHLNKFGLPGDEYGKVEEEPDYVQTKGERHPLDPTLRKFVEGRDHHSCQSCGMGLGLPEFATLFHVHHMIPVKHGGPDKKGNLILLCQNCHGMVHGYDEGRFKPSNDVAEEFDSVHNSVLLGNIVKRGLPVDYVGDAYTFYMDRARRTWLEEVELDEYDGEYTEDDLYDEEIR